MKLTSLKTRLKPANLARVPTLTQQPATVQRLRGSAGVKDRAAIKARDNGMCQACKRQGITRPGSVVDHIEPLHKGGSDHETNKELLCHPCHDAKTAAEAGSRASGGRW